MSKTLYFINFFYFQLSDASREIVYTLCGNLSSLDHNVFTIRSSRVIMHVNPEGEDVAGMMYELDYVFDNYYNGEHSHLYSHPTLPVLMLAYVFILTMCLCL